MGTIEKSPGAPGNAPGENQERSTTMHNHSTNGKGTQGNWFAGIRDPQTLKRIYHELAMQWHPDRFGGNLEKMKLINIAYQAALKMADGYVSQGEDGENHASRYDRETEQEIIDFITEQEIIDFISEVISAKLQKITLGLIGSWPWVGGTTKPHKERLGKKGLGFYWQSTRNLWYW